MQKHSRCRVNALVRVLSAGHVPAAMRCGLGPLGPHRPLCTCIPRHSTRRRQGQGVQIRIFCAMGEANELLHHIAENASQPISKYSLQDLLDLEKLSLEDRHHHLDKKLHVGISKIILLLQGLPFSLGSMGPIRNVIQDYVQDIRELRSSPPNHPVKFQRCIIAIFFRNRGMLKAVAHGLAEFQSHLQSSFVPFGQFQATNCADASERVPALKHIEDVLDEFFTIGTTLRLLISHCLKLTTHDPVEEEMLNELLMRSPNHTSYVGAICMDTKPSVVFVEAYQHAQFLCRREFGFASDLFVNGMLANDFLIERIKIPQEGSCFPYVEHHLYFIFSEVLKNALVSSIRKAGPNEKPAPIHVSFLTGSPLQSENERVVKVWDSGEGIPSHDVKKVFGYYYSTANSCVGAPVAAASERVGSEERQQICGTGLSLTGCRLLVRYFGGEMTLQSICRKGTDVYIHL